MRVFVVILLSVCLLAASAASADAALIASNFGPGNSFQTGTGNSWGLGYPGLPNNNDYDSNAVAFTNTSSRVYSLDQFRFAANYFAGDNSLTANFYGGSSDLNSATLLESFNFTAPTQFDQYIYTAVSSVHPLLLPGETYFISLSVPQDGVTIWGWQWNDQGQTGGWLSQINGAPWFVQGDVTPVFDVNASPVPEPSTLDMSSILVGMLGVVCAYKRLMRATATA